MSEVDTQLRGALETARREFGGDAVVSMEITATAEDIETVFTVAKIVGRRSRDSDRFGKFILIEEGRGATWADAFAEARAGKNVQVRRGSSR